MWPCQVGQFTKHSAESCQRLPAGVLSGHFCLQSHLCNRREFFDSSRVVVNRSRSKFRHFHITFEQRWIHHNSTFYRKHCHSDGLCRELIDLFYISYAENHSRNVCWPNSVHRMPWCNKCSAWGLVHLRCGECELHPLWVETRRASANVHLHPGDLRLWLSRFIKSCCVSWQCEYK